MAQSVSMKQIYGELKKIEKKMATKKDVESLTDTIGILGNPETMHQIAESMDDIQHNRFKEVDSVKDLMDEM